MSIPQVKKVLADIVFKTDNIWLYRLGALAFFVRNNKRLSKWRLPERLPRKPSLEVSTDDKIPSLSWMCSVGLDGKHTFIVGSGVEVVNDIVFEGAWCGDFNKCDISKANYVYGSGAQMVDGRVVFVTPKHSLESLFVLRDKANDFVYVSNSIAFLLEHSGIKVSEDIFVQLIARIHVSAKTSVEAGVDRYDRLIVESGRFALFRMTYFNFYIDNRGGLKLMWQPIKSPPLSFGAYRNHLKAVMKSVIDNAHHRSRKNKYKPVTAISKGYDSVAVSSIAGSLGVKRALTLDIEVYGISDSGAEIADILGMQASEHGHVLSTKIANLNVDFVGRDKKKALEFLATDGIGDDVAFLAFERQLKNKVFMSGTYGDVVWRMGEAPPSGLVKQVFEKSLSEFRLRVGFINFPAISIDARFSRPISAITNSDDMANWSVGGKYDRTIPRRIAEEAGVPRHMFGTVKRASSPLITNHRDLFAEAMSNVMKRYNRGE